MIRNVTEFRSVPIGAGLLMRCFRAVCLLVFLMTGVVNGQKYTVPEPVPVSSDLLVGCYYFPGYFNARRWEPIARFRCWAFTGTVNQNLPIGTLNGLWNMAAIFLPSTGITTTKRITYVITMRRWSKDFSTLGIVTSVLYFWCNEEGSDEPDSEAYLVPDYTEEQMRKLAQTLNSRYFIRPNYLRIQNRPVLMMSRPGRLIECFGVERCAAILQSFRDDKGVKIFPVAKTLAPRRAYKDVEVGVLKAAGFLAITAYNYADEPDLEPAEGRLRLSYDKMVDGYEKVWQQRTRPGVPLPYIVPVSPGWDSRPWHDGEDPSTTGKILGDVSAGKGLR